MTHEICQMYSNRDNQTTLDNAVNGFLAPGSDRVKATYHGPGWPNGLSESDVVN